MTAHPIPENLGHWWLVTGEWLRLHAIPGESITRQQMRDAIDDARPVPARAACGLRARWDMPGLGSRFGLARCAHCCHTLGIPAGAGTPANEQATAKEA
ncbi:hypothetical protein ACH4MG_27350 [Streptomyces sp. NPDC017454]|uniref:hypothetical protein n=1 Tax=Streptomyces sp. NPDC017454 TaxID=3364997 RepID=UPI0037970A51